MRVEFCAIDSKDAVHCWYDPVRLIAPSDDDDECGGPLNKHNGRLQYQLQYEYLSRLAGLQKELRQKYLALADQSNQGAEDSPLEWDGSALTKEEVEQAEADAKAMYPAPYAEYYT